MMIDPRSFIDSVKKCSYPQLIEVRDELYKDIIEYEFSMKSGQYDPLEDDTMPSRDVVYAMNLKYLSALMALMEKKYHEGICFVDKNSSRDEQMGFVNAHILNPNSLYQEDAQIILTHLIEEEDPEALNLYASMLAEGKVMEKDEVKAFKLYKKAAELGYPPAMSNLGYAYYLGNGTKKNLEKAFRYWSMAAQFSEWDSLVALGDMYFNGEVVKKNEMMAFTLYDKCYREAEHSDRNDAYPACITRIGECFLHGTGVEVNKDIASRLLNEALEIYTVQIEKDNCYAPKCIDRVRFALDELDEFN